MKRDRTDYLTWGAILLLAASLVLLLWERGPEEGPEMKRAGREAPAEDRERGEIEKFLGHYPPLPEDGDKLSAFLSSHPGNSRAHFSLGELAWRQGRLSAAAGSLRRALELDRSLADATSPSYGGEVFAKVVEEGLKTYLRERTLRPEDEGVKKAIKDLYFIQRSMGGGCD